MMNLIFPMRWQKLNLILLLVMALKVMMLHPVISR